jgi:hypothetical protein
MDAGCNGRALRAFYRVGGQRRRWVADDHSR